VGWSVWGGGGGGGGGGALSPPTWTAWTLPYRRLIYNNCELFGGGAGGEGRCHPPPIFDGEGIKEWGGRGGEGGWTMAMPHHCPQLVCDVICVGRRDPTTPLTIHPHHLSILD